MKKFILVFLVLVNVVLWAQPQPPATTLFTRYFLRSPTAAEARNRLGLVTTNVGVLETLNGYVTNLYTLNGYITNIETHTILVDGDGTGSATFHTTNVVFSNSVVLGGVTVSNVVQTVNSFTTNLNANIISNGLVVIKSDGGVVTRLLSVGSGLILANGSGNAGNPTISLDTRNTATTFDTIADMVIASVTTLTNQITVKGYYVPGDGGGGSFTLTNTYTGTNRGARIALSTANYSVDRINPKPWSLKMFGAKGDGVSSDTIAINDALTNTTTLLATAGRYVVTNRLSVPADDALHIIQGDGTDSTEFLPQFAGQETNAVFCAIGFEAGPRSYISARDFRITHSSGSTNVDGIYIENGAQLTSVENILVTGMRTGVRLGISYEFYALNFSAVSCLDGFVAGYLLDGSLGGCNAVEIFAGSVLSCLRYGYHLKDIRSVQLTGVIMEQCGTKNLFADRCGGLTLQGSYTEALESTTDSQVSLYECDGAVISGLACTAFGTNAPVIKSEFSRGLNITGFSTTRGIGVTNVYGGIGVYSRAGFGLSINASHFNAISNAVDAGGVTYLSINDCDFENNTVPVVVANSSENSLNWKYTTTALVNASSIGALVNTYLHFSDLPKIGIGQGASIPSSYLSIKTPQTDFLPSLTHDTAAMFNLKNGGLVDLAFGNANLDNFAFWLQTRHSTFDGIAYPLSLNPSGGFVGVGTLVPYSHLSITTPQTNYTPSLTHDANAAFTIKNGGLVDLAIGETTDEPFAYWIQTRHSTLDGLSYPLVLNPSGGNVGIGTLAPLKKLDVVGTMGVSGRFSAAGGIILTNGALGSDLKNWLITNDASGTLVVASMTDDLSSSGSAIQITRTGANPTLVTFGGSAQFSNGQKVRVRSTGISTTATATDYIIHCTAGSITVTLTAPGTIGVGTVLIIKDAGGNAAGANITIDGNGANIDGSGTKVMNANYQSVSLYTDGSNWFTW